MGMQPILLVTVPVEKIKKVLFINILMMVHELLDVYGLLRYVNMKINHKTPGEALCFIVCRLKTLLRLLCPT